ncbi:MAG: hypothetical protein KC560_11120, partial [Myxococcales bacterium]|nr:hypothetical protein [Myxococcales bacterium]
MSGARPRSPTRAQANALGGVALVLWTALAWLSKETAEVPVFLKMAVAFGIAGLPLAHRILIRGQAWPHAPFAFWALSLGGLFGYHLLFFLAVEHAGGGIAEVNLVNYLWPLLIVLLARRATGGGSARLAVLAGVSGFVGTAFLVCDPTIFARLGESLVGLGLAAGGAAVWALYSVGIARFGRAPLASIGAACALTAGLALAMHLACGGFASGTWLLAAGPRQWACLLLLGI